MKRYSNAAVTLNHNGTAILDHEDFSDEELVKSFVETHDEEAFNKIVDRCGDKIYRLALRITRNTSDAEDVLQEVFITLFEKLDTFKEESRFSTWLYRVVSNASLIYLRGRTKYKSDLSLEDWMHYEEDGALTGVEAKDWSNKPDEVLYSREAMEIIERVVNELPEACRIVFHLRDVEGLTNQEVAKILGLSVANIKPKIHRTRLFLRMRFQIIFVRTDRVKCIPLPLIYIYIDSRSNIKSGGGN